MWILIVLFTLLILIRQSKLIRTHFHSYLYSIGLQFGTHIYTPVCNVYSDFRYFDIVLLGKHHGYIHGHRIFHREFFRIALNYVPVGYHLVYEVNRQKQEHFYLEGTHFQVDRGILILYRKKRRGMSFVSEECNRSNQWPMSF